jgi:hypothetical protein
MLPVVSKTNRTSVAAGVVVRADGGRINTTTATRSTAGASHWTWRSAISHLRMWISGVRAGAGRLQLVLER